MASAEAGAAGGPSSARPDGGFPTLGRSRRGGRDLPGRLGRWLQPGAPAEPWSPPLASSSTAAALEREAWDCGGDPNRGREGVRREAGEEANLARILRSPCPAPPRRFPAHHPAPWLVPGAVTSRPGVARYRRPGAAGG